jgi:osmotically-inducible protein OsmY
MPPSAPKAFCAAMALAVALVVAACSTPVARTPPERAADRALVKQVEAAMANDPYVDTDHVSVEARRGIVRLKGLVGTDWDLRRVLQIASAVPGVVRVDDDLEIMDFGRSGRR